MPRKSTGCPEEEGISPAYCPILMPQRRETMNDLFVCCRNHDVTRNVLLKKKKKLKKEQMADHARSSKDIIPIFLILKPFF